MSLVDTLMRMFTIGSAKTFKDLLRRGQMSARPSLLIMGQTHDDDSIGVYSDKAAHDAGSKVIERFIKVHRGPAKVY